MRKSIFAASLLVSGLAIATPTEVTDDYIIGVLPITANNKTEVILSVPWIEVGGTNEVISVSNLVKTSSFTYDKEHPEATTLKRYNSSTGNYESWNLGQGEGGNLYWSDAGRVSAKDKVIPRGDAIILTRKKPGDAESTIYVIGQVGFTSSVTNTIAPATEKGGKIVPTYTLLAPPCATGSTVSLNNDIEFIGTIDDGDEVTTDIVHKLPKTYVRRDVEVDSAPVKKWVYIYNTASTLAAVPAGRGFWYKRCGTGELKIIWPAPSIPVAPAPAAE